MEDDLIPKPLFVNHDKALKWANRRLGEYAEIRAVALVLKAHPPNTIMPDDDPAWFINIKEGSIKPDASNIDEFQTNIIKLLKGDAVLIKTEPMIIWLPNAVKHIWSIQLIQPNKNLTKTKTTTSPL